MKGKGEAEKLNEEIEEMEGNWQINEKLESQVENLKGKGEKRDTIRTIRIQ